MGDTTIATKNIYLAGVKCLNPFDIRGSTAQLPEFGNGFCEYYAILSDNVSTTFCIGIFRHIDELKKKEYFMSKVDIGTKSISPLNLSQIKFFKEQLELHDCDEMTEALFGVDFLDIIIKQMMDDIHIPAILSVDNFTILVTGNEEACLSDGKSLSTIHINNIPIPVRSYSIFNISGFPSVILIIDNSSIVYSKEIAQYNIYDDVIFSYTVDSVKYDLQGVIARFDNSNNNEISATIRSYLFLILSSTVKAAVHYEFMNSFSVVKHILNQEHLGGMELKIGGDIPNEITNISEYLVAKAIKHISLSDEVLLIDDIRVNQPIDFSQNFIKMVTDECKDIPYCFAWTTVMASSHEEAASLAVAKIENAIGVLEFMLRNNSVFKEYAMNFSLSGWDLNINNNTHFTLSDCIYTENTFMREKISDNRVILGNSSARSLTCKEFSYFDDNPWCFDGLRFADDKKIRSILLAISWINRAWCEENPYDKIIFANISLEFCLSGEKGTTLLEDKLAELKYPADNSSNYINYVTKMIDGNNGIDDIFGISDKKEMEVITGAIVGEVKNALQRPSLRSKLKALISRLNIPLHKNDLELIDKCRRIRNDMVHGRKHDKINALEFNKICSSISRIIAYKYKWLYEKEVDKNESC